MLMFSSCGTLPKATMKNIESLRKVESKIVGVDKKLNTHAKSYVQNAIQVLQKIEPNTDVTIAIRLLEDTQDIIGKPLLSEQISLSDLDKAEKTHKDLLLQKQALTKQADELKAVIVDQAEHLAVLQRRSIFTKIQDHITDYLILLGILLGILTLYSFLKK